MIVPPVFRAVVICGMCNAVVAAGGPVAYAPLSALGGLLEAGYLLGAGVDLVRVEEAHEVLCRDAFYSYAVEEVPRASLPGLAPCWGVGT